ncbi:MAG: hypothetical protein CMA30_04680 [Euryarchaeota archaeon]|nr:hypothetical protein [Euryarchaeota archaeon]|tara:strand:- start:4277 stop:9349 length:5073 start_codon:yes stop_codon:yes gene_type:complete
MNRAVFLVSLFLLSISSPLAASSYTNSQFDDGSTSFEHVFSSSGDVNAGEITMPYGADVTEASFTFRGEASQTSWINFTSDSDYGGTGDNNGYISGNVPSPFTSGYRYYLNTQNQGMELQGNPTNVVNTLSRTGDLASTGSAIHNTTGQFAALSDQGYNSLSLKYPDFTVSSSASWGYVGVVLLYEDEYFVLKYTSSYPSQQPTILRINSTTGAYIGTASMNTGSCSATSTNSLFYNIYDATVYDGSIWTVHYTYYTVNKWSVTKTATSLSWNCQNTWYSNAQGYINGVDFDDNTGKMYLSTYSYQSADHYLHEVDSTNPTLINGTWSIGSAAGIKSSYGAGLVVNLPTIIYNEYDRSTSGYPSRHYFFNFNGISPILMGSESLSSRGHYGLTDSDDGRILFVCHYTSYCSSSSRKIHSYGDGTVEYTNPTTLSSEIISGRTQTLSASIDTMTLKSLVGYIPSGTNLEIELSNDGGMNWVGAYVGQLIQFPQLGNTIDWRVELTASNGVSPILDSVGIEYVATYRTSGYFYAYQYVGSGTSSTVAATLDWSGSTPTGTNIQVSFGAASSSSSCSSSSSGVQTWTKTESGVTKPISGSSYYLCVRIQLTTSNSAVTPYITDLTIAQHSNAPSEPALHIGGVEVWKRLSSEGALVGTQNVRTSDASSSIISTLNNLIPDTGSGMSVIPINISSESSGLLSLEQFSITYIMRTVNLDIEFDEQEVLHPRVEPYEVVTRHIIGEQASQMNRAELTLLTDVGSNPVLEWENGDIFPPPNDPDNYIELDQSSWSSTNNGILEIHWRFSVNSDFPEQDEVRFKADCTDNSGTDGFSPVDLISNEAVSVNHSYGLGWLKVRDNSGLVVSDDVPDNSWIAGGETVFFQGAMWYVGTEDAPLDNMFDVRVSREGWVESNARDTNNNNGTFFIPITMPNTDKPDGYTFEVQNFNEVNPSLSILPNSDWFRTFKVDATAPLKIDTSPKDESYEAANYNQEVRVLVKDQVGSPMALTLNYWVEADHDLNRNGQAELEEYAKIVVENYTDAPNKWFEAEIDHSRNPNMGRVSYFWDGHDLAGNSMYSEFQDSNGDTQTYQTSFGFDYDDATFITRKDSVAVFTGLEWFGHQDEQPVYAGKTQKISFGFVDENTVIDFEHISLVFDFEGPNPINDAQRISYSGLNDTFWSESQYLTILPSSKMTQTINSSGLPLILIDFIFKFEWDWPDEEMSDLVLLFKERGSEMDTQILLIEHTFKVENDLVIAPSDYSVSDVSEPRVGEIADGTRVRNDDRLSFSGRVVYEGSNIPIPRDIGILVEVFDGELIWSDGSLGDGGEFLVEVPLSSAQSLQSSPSRTCLISITNIPGEGEDMSNQLVSTTLQVIVDDSSPRVVRRISPLNVIDISLNTDLTSVPVEFSGTEDADLTGSIQTVHWIMKDSSKTITIGSGSTILGMQQDGQNVIWSGNLDLTDNGRIIPRSGDFVGFYLTGWDAAGNQFPEVSNSEASPIPELALDDTDFERQWVRLGSLGPELSIESISLSDDHVSPNTKVEIEVIILNKGGSTDSPFKVAFFAGDTEKPFETINIAGIGENERVIVSTIWKAEEVDRVRVVVDYENFIVEVNDADNSAEHSIDVAYSKYFGWIDAPRENPLTWIFIILTLITVTVVISIASKTSLDFSDGALQEDYGWENEEDEEDLDDLEHEDY